MRICAINGATLYEGGPAGLAATLEEAARRGVRLERADLRRACLHGACLDGLSAPGACLWGADLTLTDLAGANLDGADLRMASLKETCLADATLAMADCRGAYVHGALLAGADLSGCQFSCPSILGQALYQARSLKDAVYWHRGETACPLDGGILRWQGPGQELIALGGHVICNGRLREG